MAQFASAPGVRLAYDAAGVGDPPMIFVHGWCCDRSYFAPQVGHFSASHAVAAVDLRGHGESSAPDPGPGAYDIAMLADDVLAVAAAARLRQPVLVGHSLGALIGLACAARPGTIRALVMVDPAPITNEPAKAYFRESVDVVRADHGRSWRTTFVNGMFCPRMWPAGRPSSTDSLELRRGSRPLSCGRWASSTGRARWAAPRCRCWRSVRPFRPTPLLTCAAPARRSRSGRRSGPVTSSSSKSQIR